MIATAGYASPNPFLPPLPVVINPSLTLSQALTMAATDNVSLAVARADRDAASATSQSARAKTKPSLSTTTYATVGDSSNILTTSPGVSPQNIFAVAPQGFFDQDLMFMIPLFTGGKLQNNANAAQNSRDAAQRGIQAHQLSVRNLVTDDYAQAALQQTLVGVAQAQLTAENAQLLITQQKVTVGKFAPIDLLREQAAQAAASEAVLASQNNVALALVKLKTDMGVSQASQINLSNTLDDLANVPSEPATLNAALEEADGARPELAAAADQIKAAQEEVSAMQGEYAPQVYGVAMGDATATQGLQRLGYTLGLTASLPIYNGGQRRADVRGAKAKLAQAQAQAQQVRQGVDQQTADAWLTLQTATAEVADAQAGVTAAVKNYSLATLLYNVGKSTVYDRLNSLSAEVHAQGALAQAKANVIIAEAQLQAALGK